MIAYYMPTKVLMGKDIVYLNSHLFKKYGKKALIVTGKSSSKKNGSLDDCIRAFENESIDFVIFDDVEENPSLETIDRAASFGKENDVDFIVGIGGGSPLDAAKAIGVMINNPAATIDNIFELKNLKSLPMIAIPTTSGTGSEVTPYAIVTDHKAETKRNLGHKVFPEIAFLDPAYTYDLPHSITVNTAIDAFTHLAEGYLNSNANVFSDTQAEKGFYLFGKCLDALVKDEISEDVREDLMVASSLGGFVISQTATSLPHGMGYALTYNKGIPHGIANGILFPAYLESFQDKTKLEKMLKMLGVSDLDALNQVIKTLIQSDINVSDEELELYTNSMTSNAAKLKNHPEEIGFEGIYDIYKKSLR